MRHAIHWLICVSLVSALLGCGNGKIPPIEKKTGDKAATATATVPDEGKQSATQATGDTSKYVLVSLDVPNMT
ncbi:MAG: hypothetical protein JNK57_15070 [Planctomycetaceae bacterium]|jgi:predicted small lipoprotein YifL|nr:hypothetical protein [Planctomycetaceae bacterium]